MASKTKNITQMLSNSGEMKPLPLSMRSKTASELRLLADIIGRRRRPSSQSPLRFSRQNRGLKLWEAVSKEFNSFNWVSKRTPLQLRKFWGNHKCRDPIITVDHDSGKSNSVGSVSTKQSVHSSPIEQLENGRGHESESNEIFSIDSENDISEDIKMVPQIEIITEPESVLEVSRSGQLNLYPSYDTLGLGSASSVLDGGDTEIGDDNMGDNCNREESVRLQHEEQHLRIAMLRQQQMFKQVEHAAKIEEHEAAMKVFELQKEYWKRMINKL